MFLAMRLHLLPLWLLAMNAFSAEPPRPDIAVPSLDKRWMGKHKYLASKVLQASQHPPLDLYFLGDSITEFWPEIASGVWQAEFGRWHVVNCGISGDTTQNILYRITNGEFDKIAPRVVVVLAGINNLGRDPALASAALTTGIQRIVAILRGKSPSSKIILLGIFPAEDPGSPIRARIKETNKLLAPLADGKSVFYLDLERAFLDPDGNFPASLSPDGVHLNARGYQAWADAMRPMLLRLLDADAPR
jgi:beta-glucosidase